MDRQEQPLPRKRYTRAEAGPLRGLVSSITGFDDLDAFRKAAEESRAMRLRGAPCVHPSQVPILNEVFSPTAQELELARRVVEECERALAEGQGAALSIAAGFGLGFGQPLSMTLVVQLVPEHAKSTALAVRLTRNRIGQVVTPAAAGVVAGRSGSGSVFWLLGAMLVASALATQRGGPDPPGDVTGAEPAVE